MSAAEGLDQRSNYPPVSSEWVLAANPELDNFVRGIRQLRSHHGGYYPITAPHLACLFGDRGLAPGMPAVEAFRMILALQEAGILVPLSEKTKSGPDYYPTWDFPGYIPALEENL